MMIDGVVSEDRNAIFEDPSIYDNLYVNLL